MEGIKENLTCAICMEYHEDPLILACAHSFCRACLDQIYSRATDGRFMPCPVCQQNTPLGNNGISSLTRNCDLANIIEAFKKTEKMAYNSEQQASSHGSVSQSSNNNPNPPPLLGATLSQNPTNSNNGKLPSLMSLLVYPSQQNNNWHTQGDSHQSLLGQPTQYYSSQNQQASMTTTPGGQKRSFSHLLPAPEQSPEDNYIGSTHRASAVIMRTPYVKRPKYGQPTQLQQKM